VADDLSILLFTLGTAAVSTLLILPLGVGLALGLARWRGPGLGVAETLLSLPLVLPPTAVGLVLLQGVSAVWTELLFTPGAVVLAAMAMSLPLLVRSARTAFEEVDPRLPALARTLGCSPARAFFRVTLPLAWRGVLAGAVLAFARALGEFGATILVAGNIPGRTQTLSLAIFHRVQLGDDAGALRLAGWTGGVAFAALGASEWLVRRRKARAA
jgi:molybdate transport system permease protein